MHVDTEELRAIKVSYKAEECPGTLLLLGDRAVVGLTYKTGCQYTCTRFPQPASGYGQYA